MQTGLLDFDKVHLRKDMNCEQMDSPGQGRALGDATVAFELYWPLTQIDR